MLETIADHPDKIRIVAATSAGAADNVAGLKIAPTGQSFRPAGLMDIPAIIDIIAATQDNVLHNRVSFATLVDNLTNAGKGWLCEMDGQTVGFGIAINSGSLWALYVLPAYQRRGIGTQLMRLALGWLRQRGVVMASLTTNAFSIGWLFYRKKGWLQIHSTAHGLTSFYYFLAGSPKPTDI